MEVNKIKYISLPKFKDFRGSLSFFENNNQIPFEIKSMYWINNLNCENKLNFHTSKNSHEFIIALSGSFDVIVNENGNISNFHLNKPNYGLFIPNVIWRRIDNFSENSSALITSSSI